MSLHSVLFAVIPKAVDAGQRGQRADGLFSAPPAGSVNRPRTAVGQPRVRFLARWEDGIVHPFLALGSDSVSANLRTLG